MKQKEVINQTCLNLTQISSNAIDHSYQACKLPENQIVEKRTPLHSHYLFYKNDSNLNSKLRLLNNKTKSGEEHKLKVIEKLDKFPNKPAFGCSLIRKLNIFEGKKEDSEVISNNQNITIILQKTSTISNQEPFSKSRDSPIKISSGQQKCQTKLGFGVGGHIQRVSSMDVIYKAGGPGPGQYGLSDPVKSVKRKYGIKGELKNNSNSNIGIMSIQKRVIRQMKLRQESCQNIKQKVIPPGPGSYNLPCLASQNKENSARSRWKQLLNNKKLKTKLMFQKLKSQRNIKKSFLKEVRKFKQKIDRYPNETDSKTENQLKNIRQPKKSMGSKHKYLRNELKDKTNSYLPKMEQIKFEYQNRGPIYKNQLSNCFVMKNDHVFQAHYYKQAEKQSQYIFMKAGVPENSEYNFLC